VSDLVNIIINVMISPSSSLSYCHIIIIIVMVIEDITSSMSASVLRML